MEPLIQCQWRTHPIGDWLSLRRQVFARYLSHFCDLKAFNQLCQGACQSCQTMSKPQSIHSKGGQVEGESSKQHSHRPEEKPVCALCFFFTWTRPLFPQQCAKPYQHILNSDRLQEEINSGWTSAWLQGYYLERPSAWTIFPHSDCLLYFSCHWSIPTHYQSSSDVFSAFVSSKP